MAAIVNMRTRLLLRSARAHALLAEAAEEALERMAGIAPPPPADWLGAPAYLWTGAGPRAVPSIEAPMLDQLCGIDVQKAAVAENARRLAQGHAAHDILLWGARGMGKSALVRAAVEDTKAEPLLQVFRDTVVVRGQDPMAPREMLELKMPATEQS